MSNEFIRDRLVQIGRDQWLTIAMLGCLAGLGAVVPAPAAVLRTVTRSTVGPVGPQTLDAAAMALAGGVVWALIGWTALIAAIAVTARAPGRVGRTARRLLRRMAPGFVRRVVIAGMGVSVLAGAAACGTPAGGTGSAADRPAVVPAAAVVAVAAGSPAVVGGPAGTGGEIGTVAGERAGHRDATSDRIGAAISRSPTERDPAAGTPGAVRSEPGTATRGVPSPAGRAATGAAADLTVGRIDLDWPVERPSGTTPRVDIDWPATDPAPAPAPAPAPERRSVPQRPAAVVIVEPGDSLWRIAAEHLGPGATDDRIDAAWRTWFAANRDVIGSDPDHIEPGQQLRSPDTAVTHADTTGSTSTDEEH